MRSIPLSTTISPEIKRAADAYCKRNGIKMSFLVERALVEQLEDEMDIEAYHQRRNEPTESLESIVAARKQRRKSKP